jgi:hypothetical protein
MKKVLFVLLVLFLVFPISFSSAKEGGLETLAPLYDGCFISHPNNIPSDNISYVDDCRPDSTLLNAKRLKVLDQNLAN